MALISHPEELREIFRNYRTVAVLGAHPVPAKAAHYVPAYLHQQGYRILPVNPVYAGQELWGQPVKASLGDWPETIEVVDVFRRSEAVPGHLQEILNLDPLPKVVWMQLGVRNDAVAHSLTQAGIDVVQDRCMLADHRDLRVGVVGGPGNERPAAG